ncbi:MAG: GTPase HflX, partial [Spirochaetota bacterium]
MSNDNTDEKAILVAVRRAREESNHQNEGLEELAGLLATLGVSSVRRLPIQVREFRPQFLVGSGKAEEIMEAARTEDAGLIVFDNELSPAQ